MRDYQIELVLEARHLKKAIEKRAAEATSAIREIVIFGRGAIVQLKTTMDPVQVLEDLLADVRAFLSTRARGGK